MLFTHDMDETTAGKLDSKESTESSGKDEEWVRRNVAIHERHLATMKGVRTLRRMKDEDVIGRFGIDSLSKIPDDVIPLG